ncbi:hypothetical protein [Photobacterium leiognathi]|uniref:Uncharacterized protein n=1 Tax=Photobacterium leiognathi TaxID=553611 RepID=A0ABX5GFS6_PHOLE|nr:hypothetical protein [Photobacterium leiognathi]KJF87653.1 hypothetical protein UB42_17295 [Photobacterium leiognathi]PSV82007.1 hypothetical protein CTM94_11205 [Photobacterium leiognathi]
MKTVFKTSILAAFIFFFNSMALAKDGDFKGNVSFDTMNENQVLSYRYMEGKTAERSHSGVVFEPNAAALSFEEKLLSAADK